MLNRGLSADAAPPFARADAEPAGWAVSPGYIDYPAAVATMERRVGEIAEGRAGELIWLLEHPPLYTAGVSAKAGDLLAPTRLPVFTSGRGGQYTYHGPGQRVVYLMLDLSARRRDVRAYVQALETWIIDALAQFNLKGELRAGRVGVWIERRTPGRPPQEDKIAAIGVKVRRWVAFHGVAINVEPDLGQYAGIVPCGIADHGVTSLVDLGLTATLDDADAALKASFQRVFGPVVDVASPAT